MESPINVDHGIISHRRHTGLRALEQSIEVLYVYDSTLQLWVGSWEEDGFRAVRPSFTTGDRRSRSVKSTTIYFQQTGLNVPHLAMCTAEG